MTNIFDNGALCQNCFAPLNFTITQNGHVVCEYCRSKWNFSDVKNTDISNNFSEYLKFSSVFTSSSAIYTSTSAKEIKLISNDR